jgi:hypothetical protein
MLNVPEDPSDIRPLITEAKIRKAFANKCGWENGFARRMMNQAGDKPAGGNES